MRNISNVWGQLRKYKIAEQKGVWRPIKCGSTLFESSTEALFVLPLIAQAPKTVGRANYFSLNWKCNFWPLSRLKRRNQAFPFNGIVFSGRLSFQNCGCGAFLCYRMEILYDDYHFVKSYNINKPKPPIHRRISTAASMCFERYAEPPVQNLRFSRSPR